MSWIIDYIAVGRRRRTWRRRWETQPSDDEIAAEARRALASQRVTIGWRGGVGGMIFAGDLAVGRFLVYAWGNEHAGEQRVVGFGGADEVLS